MRLTTIIAAMLVAFVCSYVVYFGFTSNYTTGVYSPGSFTHQYEHDVFKYRILSRYMLLGMDKLLTGVIPADSAEPRIRLLDSHASERFYYAYFCLNTAFLILSSAILAFLLDMNEFFTWKPTEKTLLVFFLPVLLCLTQFVIVPYDICSYFFQLLIIYTYMSGMSRHYRLTIVIVSLLIAMATLNRESSAVTVAFLVIIGLYKWGWTLRTWVSMAAFSATFLLPYLALRHFIQDPGWKDPFYVDKFLLNLNWDLSHWGLVFWGLCTWLVLSLCPRRENRRLIFWYYLACMPYIWTCLMSGILWELRLFIPIFLGSILLSQLDVFRFNSALAVRARRTDWL